MLDKGLFLHACHHHVHDAHRRQSGDIEAFLLKEGSRSGKDVKSGGVRHKKGGHQKLLPHVF